MQIDYGHILDYKDKLTSGKKGYGFVSRTIQSSRDNHKNVFFHIKQVKKKYPELAQRLDNGDYHDVSFWYVNEATSKGEQVKELYLEISELPPEIALDLIHHVEEFWEDIINPHPKWLNKVTIDLGGQEYRDRLSQNRTQALRKYYEALETRELEAKERRKIEEVERKARERDLREAAWNAELVRRREQEEALKSARIEQLKRERAAWKASQVAEEERQKRFRAEKVAKRLALEKQSKERRLARERQREAERLALEKQKESIARTRINNISKFCEERRISTLIHFTRVQNLASILQHGLVSRDKVNTILFMTIPIFNDNQRIDGSTNATCLSISFPNYMMLYPFSQNNQEEWVNILLDPAILWDLDCAFCQENAASNNVRSIPLSERKKFYSLENMFGEHPLNSRQNLNIPDFYPTHPQAEVLVFEQIHPKYIQAIHFFEREALFKWQKQNPNSDDFLITCDNKYFQGRCDYDAWRPRSSNDIMNNDLNEQSNSEIEENQFNEYYYDQQPDQEQPPYDQLFFRED